MNTSSINASSSSLRKRIFTWHIHGSYLYYLSLGNYDIYIPVRDAKDEGYYGLGETFPFGSNVIEVPFEEVKRTQFDIVLFQTDKNYLQDQFEVLSKEQRKLPRIFLKHDPPWSHPVNTRLVVDDPEVQVVHVTHFNKLMWDNNNLDARVIMHGVPETAYSWNGRKEKGIVVINNLPSRGRLLGYDIFKEVSKKIPLDIIGMGNASIGGKEILHPSLAQYISEYRFFFNPIRYTSLGLAVCEAMMTGMPVIGFSTTEMPTVIENGKNGFVHTDPEYLIDKMRLLLDNKSKASLLGKNAKSTAVEKFDIHRFTGEWEGLFNKVTERELEAEDAGLVS